MQQIAAEKYNISPSVYHPQEMISNSVKHQRSLLEYQEQRRKEEKNLLVVIGAHNLVNFIRVSFQRMACDR